MYRQRSVRFALATLTTVAMTSAALVGAPNQAFAGTTTATSTITVGSSPQGVAYDAANGDVYVANGPPRAQGTVSVIDGRTNTVTSTISVGIVPNGVAYDAANGDVYVANYSPISGSGAVSVIDGRTNKVTGTPITVGSDPAGVAYDAGNGDVYVANFLSHTVSVIDGSTNTVKKTIPVGSDPDGVAYDAGNGDVYVTNIASNTVSVIDGSTNTVTGTPISVGSSPSGVAYDAANGDVYVANYASGRWSSVSVIDGSTNTVTGAIAVDGDGPTGVAYDAANGDVYVTNQGSGTVSVIDGSTNKLTGTPISVGSSPSGVAYDAGNGDVYVTNQGSGTVSVIVPPLPVITNSSVVRGSTIGTAAITATPNMAGDTFAVQVTSTTPSAVTTGASVPSGASTYTSGTNISNVAVGDVVTLYEVSSSGSVLAATSFTLTKSDILGATITYHANGARGTAPTDSTQYMIGASATVAGQGSLTKTGYTFAGWNTKVDGSGTSYASGASLAIPAHNVTLYAQWTVNHYTVTFNSNGGSTVAPETVAYSGTATQPTNPAKAGYTFAGWYSDSGLATPYNFTTPVTASETLYAQWTANPYTMVYIGNGNTGGTAPIDGHTHTIGAKVTVLGDGTLTKAGYTFVGWNTQADGSGTNYAPGSTLTIGSANATLYAQWRVVLSVSTPSTLPNVLEGIPYTQTFQGTGGVSPYSFSDAGGSLPNGVTLQSNGSLVGTPQQSGTFHFTAQIKDNAGTTTAKDMSLYVIPTAPAGYLKTTSTKQVVSSSGGLLTAKSSQTTAKLAISAGTFTNPLQVDITTGAISQGLVPSGWKLVAAYGVNFDTNDSPVHSLSFTLLNQGITPQSKVYKIVNGKLVPVTATVSQGKALITFTTDPDFVVLQPKPVPQATKPVTGFPAVPWAAGGLFSILTGGLALWWQRRRKSFK